MAKSCQLLQYVISVLSLSLVSFYSLRKILVLTSTRTSGTGYMCGFSVLSPFLLRSMLVFSSLVSFSSLIVVIIIVGGSGGGVFKLFFLNDNNDV